LEVALRAARTAGELLKKKLSEPRHVRHKSEIDLVTDADEESEAAIVEAVRRSFPGDSVIAEEGTVHRADAPRRWLIDPLDGTTNFAHGYPFFAVSIALEIGGAVQVGVVHAPGLGETFWAERGQGAWLNGTRLTVSRTTRLGESLLCSGFPYERAQQEQVMPLWARAVLAAQGVRRDGSAALDLCYVAAGRFDGYFERGIHAWDIAAGILAVEEAGGTVTSYNGGSHDLWMNEVVATNGHIHPELLGIVSTHP